MEQGEFEESLLPLNCKANELCRSLSARADIIVTAAYESSIIIVDDFKKSLWKDKENNPGFYFWKHFCVVEKGVTAVTIRWKKYSGKNRFSDPVETSGMKNFRLPAKAFVKCSRPEKNAIMLAEKRFSKIRRINSQIGSMLEAARAVRDMTALGGSVNEIHENDVLSALEEIDLIGQQYAQAEKAQYEFDREKFRRSLGL